jgi:copper chaperone
MKQLMQFKTTLNCQNCVAKVKPFLDKIEGIDNWSVDTNNPDKILSVESSGATDQQIIDAVEGIGFDIEKI